MLLSYYILTYRNLHSGQYVACIFGGNIHFHFNLMHIADLLCLGLYVLECVWFPIQLSTQHQVLVKYVKSSKCTDTSPVGRGMLYRISHDQTQLIWLILIDTYTKTTLHMVVLQYSKPIYIINMQKLAPKEMVLFKCNLVICLKLYWFWLEPECTSIWPTNHNSVKQPFCEYTVTRI